MSEPVTAATTTKTVGWKHDVATIRRAALTAIALRLLIGLAKSIAKCGLSRKLAVALRDEALGLDPWKWALVFSGWACFAPLVRAFEAALKALNVCGEDVSAQVATVAAGVIVAQPIRVMEVSTRTELGLYLLSRAAHSVASAELLPRLPKLLRDFGHWDAFFVGLTGSQILYSLVFEPQTHSTAYRAFLERCVMTPRSVWDTAAAYHRSHMSPKIIECCVERGVPPPADVSDMNVVCRVLHPHTSSCDRNVLGWLANHIVTFCIPLYLPLKVVSTAVFGSKKFMKDPLMSTLNIVKSVAQSSLFLSLYCGGPMRVMCAYNQLGIRHPPSIAVAAGIACGLSTLLETKSRRLDLALYCCMHAFRAAVLTLVRRGYLNPPRRQHVMVMYTLALSVLLHYFRFKPEGLHPNVNSSLKFLLGARWQHAEHAPASASTRHH